MTKRIEIILLAGAIAIAALGFVAEMLWGKDLFARSGSLIVIYGVILVGRAIVAGERELARNEGRFEKLEAAYHQAAVSEDKTTDPEVFNRLAEIYGGMRESHVARSGRLLAAEAGILCFGTLIWGFGDLFTCSVWDGTC